MIEAIHLGAVGLVLELAAVALFAWSLASFGRSWRVGIDRARPGSLSTGGAFSWSRNPIFLALDAMVLGAFLVTGHAALGAFALLTVPALHRQIRAEERFLAGIHGADYRRYCEQVNRYLGRHGALS